MTFNEIYNQLQQNNRSLIRTESFIGIVPAWFTGLNFEQLAKNSLDRMYLSVHYTNSVSVFEYGATLDITVTGIMERNRYKFDNLYRTIIQEYNPIENYDRIEDTTVDIDGSNTDNTKADSTTVRTGSEIDTKSGGFSNSKTGTMAETTVFSGSEKHEQTGTITSTNQTRAFNSGLTDVSKNTSTTPTGTDDTLTFADRKNVAETTFNGYKDTTEYNALKNQHSYNSVTDTTADTSTVSGVRKDKHVTTSRIHGNIGVTTSAQMLESERKLSDFDFLDIVYRTVLDELSCGFVSTEEGYYDD